MGGLGWVVVRVDTKTLSGCVFSAEMKPLAKGRTPFLMVPVTGACEADQFPGPRGDESEGREEPSMRVFSLISN